MEGGGREAQEGAGQCIGIVDSHCHIAETNKLVQHCKAIILQSCGFF